MDLIKKVYLTTDGHWFVDLDEAKKYTKKMSLQDPIEYVTMEEFNRIADQWGEDVCVFNTEGLRTEKLLKTIKKKLTSVINEIDLEEKE